jgi:type I restriction enzyme M protein
MTNSLKSLEDKLWNAADKLRVDSELSSNEYSTPVLGLIFLKYADFKFGTVAHKLGTEDPDKLDVLAEGVMYLPADARYEILLKLPEGTDIGRAINEAMKAVERENEDLRGILPMNYTTIPNQILVDLLKNFNSIDFAEGDIFGKIYEYFLGKFAMSEGQGGGEFFTPTSIVKLIVEVIEPYHGRIFDPACGSGGMFVQSANFVQAHHKSANTQLSVYGQEKTAATVRLGKMNLAVHGINGDIRQGNSYYDDIHESRNKFDFVMANPPFNVDGIDKDRIKNDSRFSLGMPNTDNGNYIWIQSFYSALKDTGRAGFVMANSASDARNSELVIRKKLLLDKVVDVMVNVGSNMFYTVTLPCQLWFLDKAKRKEARGDKVLFIDIREIYQQIDRSHRELSLAQVEFIANIVNLYRGEVPEFIHGSEALFEAYKMDTQVYDDVLGLCKVASLSEIEAQGWSLNPGRYVGVVAKEKLSATDFKAELSKRLEEFESLTKQSVDLENEISETLRGYVGK